jgi:hypothetical protein
MPLALPLMRRIRLEPPPAGVAAAERAAVPAPAPE